jgi:hypothetical protein
MTTVVVGGHSRKVGKTSVAAGLIAAFPELRWTAIKISSHWHGDSYTDDACEIYEENNGTGLSDTSRFLAAGAARSLWMRVRESEFEKAVQRLLSKMQSDPFLIIESNRILQYIQPDLYILVLRYDVEDFKDSARDTLSRAHAIVAVTSNASTPSWKGISPKSLSGIPLFATADPKIIPKGLIDFVRVRLSR